MKFFTSLFFLIVFTFSLNSQTTLSGKVTDAEDGSELIYANIKISKDGVFTVGASTDFDGIYAVNLDAGVYYVEVSYVGYSSKKVENVLVIADQDNELDIELRDGIKLSHCPLLRYYRIPLIEQDNTTSGQKIINQNIENLPIKNIREMATMTPGLSLNRF